MRIRGHRTKITDISFHPLECLPVMINSLMVLPLQPMECVEVGTVGREKGVELGEIFAVEVEIAGSVVVRAGNTNLL